VIKLLNALFDPLLLIEVVFAISGPDACLILVFQLFLLPLLASLFYLSEEVSLASLVTILNTL
jgi:hypothetical protein